MKDIIMGIITFIAFIAAFYLIILIAYLYVILYFWIKYDIAIVLDLDIPNCEYIKILPDLRATYMI